MWEKLKESKFLEWIMWITIIGTLLTAVLEGVYATPFFIEKGHPLMAGLSVIFAFIHAYKRYGLKHFLVFLGIVLIVGNFYENLSIATTFPFGPYHYTDSLGPKFIYTPLIINIAYFQMIYIVWNLSSAILSYYENTIKGKFILAIPVVSMFIMVMWDVAMDPIMSTLSGHWEWHQGGAFFGVPIQNYYGWYLCVFTMFQLFSLYMSKQGKQITPKFVITKKNWIQLVMIYSAWPLSYILKGFFATNESITAMNGQVWMSKDILQTAGLMGLSTMIFISILVLLKTCFLNELPNS